LTDALTRQGNWLLPSKLSANFEELAVVGSWHLIKRTILVSAFGPKRTSLVAPHMSTHGGKADMGGAVQMSAFDPKRTSGGWI